MQIFIDPSTDKDPFVPGLESEERRKKLMEQIGAQLARQQRTFVFSLVIFGHYARLLRWDRAACLVSEKFNLCESPLILANFLWTFNLLCARDRGFDPTATDANPREVSMLKKTIRLFLERSPRSADQFRACLKKDDYPVYKIEVPALDGTVLKLIVGKPFHTYTRAGGRATRVYLAYLVSERRLVILKDYWGPEKPEKGYSQEGETYEHLRQHNVPHLPKIIAAGSVLVDGVPQKTRAQRFSHSKGFIRQRIVQEIYFPLSTISSSKELIQVFRDAIECMWFFCSLHLQLTTVSTGLCVAYHSANVLHQDVSIGNIMVTLDGRGILNDWDCAWKKTSACRTQEGRVVGLYSFLSLRSLIVSRSQGTWKYMSMRICDNPWKPHDIQDDLESCFWVLLWTTIHHIKASHGWRWSDWETFDFGTTKSFIGRKLAGPTEDEERERKIGGKYKSEFLQEQYRNSGYPHIRELEWRCQPFDKLLHDFAAAFDHIWYLADGFTEKNFDPTDCAMADKMKVALDQNALLFDPTHVLRMFETALAQDGWLENDAVPDMFPIRSGHEWDQYEPVLLAHVKRRRVQLREKIDQQAQDRVERKKQRLAEKAAKDGTQSTDVSVDEVEEAREPSPVSTDYPPPFQPQAKSPKVELRRSTRIRKPPQGFGDPSIKLKIRIKRKRKVDGEDTVQPYKRVKIESYEV